jgi:hypothetical protein
LILTASGTWIYGAAGGFELRLLETGSGDYKKWRQSIMILSKVNKRRGYRMCLVSLAPVSAVYDESGCDLAQQKEYLLRMQ